MKKDDKIYLKHILDAIHRIKNYINKISYKEFKKDNLRQDAIIRQIEIIGEATKRISEKLKNKYKHIPWKDIAGMRDKLIHKYFGVDIEIVWMTVEKDIPELERQIKEILRKEIKSK